MNYFHMTYEQVLNSPMQVLNMLAKSIPKFEAKEKTDSEESEGKSSILEFAKQHNLLNK